MSILQYIEITTDITGFSGADMYGIVGEMKGFSNAKKPVLHSS